MRAGVGVDDSQRRDLLADRWESVDADRLGVIDFQLIRLSRIRIASLDRLDRFLPALIQAQERRDLVGRANSRSAVGTNGRSGVNRSFGADARPGVALRTIGDAENGMFE